MKRYYPYFLLAALTLAAGFWLGQNNKQTEPANVAVEAKSIYVCPMHSHIVQDHPGVCPVCGMDLVESGEENIGTQIYVNSATRQKFGVRLTAAERRNLTRDLTTWGTLVADINHSQHISANVMGVLLKLHVTHPGQKIAAGSPIYEIYSEELLNTQNEYIDYLYRNTQAVKSAQETRARNRQMLSSMHGEDPAGKAQLEKGMKQTEEQILSILQPMQRDGERLTAKLKAAGFTGSMLDKLAKQHNASSTVTIQARQNCTVTEVNGRIGMPVSAMTNILSCAETGRAWLEIVFYPDQFEFIHQGETLQAEFPDGTLLQTKLENLGTVADDKTRTLRARVPVRLPAGINLGEIAEITVHSSPRAVLTVPVSAVIRSGHGNYVMKSLGNGHFMPQKVITGISNDEYIGIIDGLESGDHVAINGQFLLDSAASIAESAQRYRENK